MSLPNHRMAHCLLLLLVCLMSGCSSSSVVNEWKSDTSARAPFRKILVIALGKRQDLRSSYEDAFVRELQQRGMQAVAGHTLLPNETDKLDRAALSKTVADLGSDAVIVTRVVKVESRVGTMPTYVPPSYGLYGYHANIWSSYYEPGGVQAYTQTVATLETSLFDTKTERLVWQATTETFDADKAQRQIPGLVKALTAAMAKAKVIT